jgi:ABC-type branched-subunit amino acid transport system ATPase component
VAEHRRLEYVYELFAILKRRRNSGGTSLSGGLTAD